MTLEENILRERVTTDIATGGGQYDIMTIGNYEVPIWGKQSWLVPLEFSADYDVDDLLPAIRGGLTVDDKLYAAPFYGESAFLMYRTDLFEKAGLTMPEDPTWDFIGDAARKITDRAADINGICLRGKAGWGENMASDRLDGQQLRRPLVRRGVGAAVRPARVEGGAAVLRRPDEGRRPAGRLVERLQREPDALPAGQVRACGSTPPRRAPSSPTRSSRPSPTRSASRIFPNKDGVDNHGNWLWSWNLAIPASSKNADAAKTFIEWATSKDYTELVAAKEGWANAPPGTRTSLYENADYLDAAALRRRRPRPRWTPPTSPSRRCEPVPYTGGQFVAIPEFQSIGTTVGQLFSAVIAGQSSVDDALAQAQSVTEREMRRAGY